MARNIMVKRMKKMRGRVRINYQFKQQSGMVVVLLLQIYGAVGDIATCCGDIVGVIEEEHMSLDLVQHDWKLEEEVHLVPGGSGTSPVAIVFFKSFAIFTSFKTSNGKKEEKGSRERFVYLG